jgi:prepilin-type N-terminal cleavage/methylation domain-containing protein
MVFLKKSFTLVEMMVVIGVIGILSTIAYFGVRQAGRGEGQKADYLKFYEDIKSMKIRANLGKQNEENLSSVQNLTFTLGQSLYEFNSRMVVFRNKSIIQSVSTGEDTYLQGKISINFYPVNYVSDPMPTAFGYYYSCAQCPRTELNNLVMINVADSTGISSVYPIIISGSGYLINTVGMGSLSDAL